MQRAAGARVRQRAPWRLPSHSALGLSLSQGTLPRRQPSSPRRSLVPAGVRAATLRPKAHARASARRPRVPPHYPLPRAAKCRSVRYALLARRLGRAGSPRWLAALTDPVHAGDVLGHGDVLRARARRQPRALVGLVVGRGARRLLGDLLRDLSSLALGRRDGSLHRTTHARSGRGGRAQRARAQARGTSRAAGSTAEPSLGCCCCATI